MIYIASLNDKSIDSLFYLNEYYGITQNPDTKDFIIIMKYYKSDLRNYITKEFGNIKWDKKLKILLHIAEGLRHIHNQNIIHQDLHSGNILYENDDDVIISDLGISKSAMESTNDRKVYGIISYMAPEILQGKKCTKASDIYSFSMIMWEFMTGRIPYDDFDNRNECMIKICDGYRPELEDYTAPNGYIKLMQECWNPDPINRPSSDFISNRLHTIMVRFLELSDIAPIIHSKNKQLSQQTSRISTISSEIGN